MLPASPSVHLHRLSLSELREIGGCIWRVLLDSERLEDIVTAEEIAAQGQLKYLVDSGVYDSNDGEQLWASQADFSQLTLAELEKLPVETLGGALGRFLTENGLSTETYSNTTAHTKGEREAYLLRQIWLSHDIWHVLMNFTIAGHDEILVHAFSLAQTGMPSSVVLMLFGSVKHMLLEKRWACFTEGMSEAYRRGKQARSLLMVDWFKHLERPLEEVRAEFGIQPWTVSDHRNTQPSRLRWQAASLGPLTGKMARAWRRCRPLWGTRRFLDKWPQRNLLPGSGRPSPIVS